MKKSEKLLLKIGLFLGFHEKNSQIKEKPLALQRELPALQNVKFLNFFYFVFLVPDPQHCHYATLGLTCGAAYCTLMRTTELLCYLMFQVFSSFLFRSKHEAWKLSFCDLDEDATEGVKVRFGEEVVLPQPPFPVPVHLYGLLQEQDQNRPPSVYSLQFYILLMLHSRTHHIIFKFKSSISDP